MKKIVDAGTYKAMGQNVPIAFRGKSDKHNFNRRANAGRYIDSNYGSGMEDLYAIMEKYRIKGFEFGNWVTQQERADYVASLVTTLEELYSVLGSRNIGIDKNIGIAFGARGSRGAKAHYEPCLNMINLTRAHGAGSLAHEYGHALDYNLGGFLDQHKMYNALSGGHETSATLEDNVGGQLRALVNQIVDSIANGKNMQKMAALNRDMMAKNGKVVYTSYWFRRTEIFARFFEQYVCYCLYERHISNRLLHKNWAYYLAEIVYVEKDDFMKIKPVADKLMKEAAGFLNGVKGHRLRATAYPKPVIEKPVRKLYVQTSTKVVENKKVAAETKPATSKNVIDKLEVRRQAIKLGVIEGQGQSVHFTAKLKDLVELYHGHKQEVLNIVCDMWADDTIRRRGGGRVELYKEEAQKEARRVLASRKTAATWPKKGTFLKSPVDGQPYIITSVDVVPAKSPYIRYKLDLWMGKKSITLDDKPEKIAGWIQITHKQANRILQAAADAARWKRQQEEAAQRKAAEEARMKAHKEMVKRSPEWIKSFASKVGLQSATIDALYKLCTKDDLRPVMCGIYCHPDGYIAATDGHVAATVKAKIPANMKGKIFAPSGQKIEGKFPNIAGVLLEEGLRMKAEDKMVPVKVVEFNPEARKKNAFGLLCFDWNNARFSAERYDKIMKIFAVLKEQPKYLHTGIDSHAMGLVSKSVKAVQMPVRKD